MRVSRTVFPQDHHQARGKYSSHWGIYNEDNFMIPKSEIYHAGLDVEMVIGRTVTGIKLEGMKVSLSGSGSQSEWGQLLNVCSMMDW